MFMLLLAVMFLFILMEPASASPALSHDDIRLVGVSGKAGNADWNVDSWLCTMNNQLCKDKNNILQVSDNDKQIGLFNMIDDVLDNQVANVRIRMFKSRIAKNDNNAGFVDQEAKRLSDEISRLQTNRDILMEQLKDGTITQENYAAALEQTDREEKSIKKQASEIAKIVRENLHDEKSSADFEKISGSKKRPEQQKRQK